MQQKKTIKFKIMKCIWLFIYNFDSCVPSSAFSLNSTYSVWGARTSSHRSSSICKVNKIRKFSWKDANNLFNRISQASFKTQSVKGRVLLNILISSSLCIILLIPLFSFVTKQWQNILHPALSLTNLMVVSWRNYG
jgi:hypothetical protein